MRPALRLLTAFGIACVWAGAAPAVAQTPPPEQAPAAAAESPEARAVAQVVLAAELAAWARGRRDAEGLLVAARMLDEVPLRAGADSQPGEAPVLTAAGLRQEAAALRGAPVSVDEIVVTGTRVPSPAERALAEREARERERAEAELERRERERAQRRPAPVQPAPAAPPPPPPPPPPAWVGVASSPFGEGPVSTVRRLGSRETWSFEVDARGAEVLRIAAIGDGDTDVDLTIRDAAGRVLCADGFGDHYPVCTLAPSSPSRLRVHIVNRGAVWTRVQVLSN